MPNWLPLAEELDHWAKAGAVATFWWRDDDAVQPTAQLDRLLECAEGTPLALAVVPALASPTLAARLSGGELLTIVQHGWRHSDHASGGCNEYPAVRLRSDVSREFADGRRRLTTLFGSRAIPVFAPPWHGFDDCFLPLLHENGLGAISVKGPRAAAWITDNVFQANVHVSPIKWTDPPSFESEEIYVNQFVGHLRGRRLGSYDCAEPTGLLTHHLSQDAPSFDFIARFVEFVSRHPAAAWLDAKVVFAPALQ